MAGGWTCRRSAAFVPHLPIGLVNILVCSPPLVVELPYHATFSRPGWPYMRIPGISWSDMKKYTQRGYPVSSPPSNPMQRLALPLGYIWSSGCQISVFTFHSKVPSNFTALIVDLTLLHLECSKLERFNPGGHSFDPSLASKIPQ